MLVLNAVSWWVGFWQQPIDNKKNWQIFFFKPPALSKSFLGTVASKKFEIHAYIYEHKSHSTIYIGPRLYDETEGLRDLGSHGHLYKHSCAKHKGVYGFQNPIGPKGSSYMVFIHS